MTDRILWASVVDLNAAVRAAPWPQPAYMYLERGLGAWLTEEETADGVRLEAYDPTADFAAWEKGRVFCADYELRWEQSDGVCRAVLIGAAPAAEGFSEAADPNLAAAEQRTRSIFLWGLRLDDADLDAVGVTRAGRGEPHLELRIPRVLRYPTTGAKRRAALTVCEYLHPQTGAVLHYRLTGVEER